MEGITYSNDNTQHNSNGMNHQFVHNNDNNNGGSHRVGSSSSASTTASTTFTLEQQQQKQIEALRRQLEHKEDEILDLSATITTIEAETNAKLQAAAANNGQQQENTQLQQQLQAQQQHEAQLQAEKKRLEDDLRRARHEANLSNSQIAQLQKKLLLQQQQAAILKQQQQQQQQQNHHLQHRQHPHLLQHAATVPSHVSASPSIPAQQQHVNESIHSSPKQKQQRPPPPASSPAHGQETASTTTVNFRFPLSSFVYSSLSGQRLAQHLLQTATAVTATASGLVSRNHGCTTTSSSSIIGPSSFSMEQQQRQQQERILLYLGKVASATNAASLSLISSKSSDYDERSILLFLLQECSSSLPLLFPPPQPQAASSQPRETGETEHQTEGVRAAAASARSQSQKSHVEDDMDIVIIDEAPSTSSNNNHENKNSAAAATTTGMEPTNAMDMITSALSRDAISYAWLHHFILAASYNNGASRDVLHWLFGESQHLQQQQQSISSPSQVPMQKENAHESNKATITTTTKSQRRKRKSAIRMPIISAATVTTALSATANTTTSTTTDQETSDPVQRQEKQEVLDARLAFRAKRLVGQRDAILGNNAALRRAREKDIGTSVAVSSFWKSCRNYALLVPLIRLDHEDKDYDRAKNKTSNYNPASTTSVAPSSSSSVAVTVVEISIRALQIVALLLESQLGQGRQNAPWIESLLLVVPASCTGMSAEAWSSVPTTATTAEENHGDAQNDQTQQRRQEDEACLLDLWCHASHILLDRSVDKNAGESGRKIAKRRLLGQDQEQQQPIVTTTAVFGSNISSTSTKQRSVNGDAASLKPTVATEAQQHQQQSDMALSSQLLDRMSTLSDEILQNWMAHALHVLCIFWRTAKESAARLSNETFSEALNSSHTQHQQQQQHQAFWLDTTHSRARNLLAAVLDCMQAVLIPTPALHNHPLAMEAVAWLQCLVDQPSVMSQPQDLYDSETVTTTGSRNLQQHQPCFLLLLRTQMSTTASTPKRWQRSATAIGVAVKFFHTLVIRQHQVDHLSSHDGSNSNNRLNPVRDALVRFFDSLLRVTQRERRRVENSSLNNKNTGAGGKKAASTATTNFVSFWALLSEYRELYTSAAALLLATTASATTSTVEKGISDVGCHVDADIRAMIRMQMDELIMDEEDREELQSLA